MPANRANLTQRAIGAALGCLLTVGTLGFAASAHGASQQQDKTSTWNLESDCTACHASQVESMGAEGTCLLATHASLPMPGTGDLQQDEPPTGAPESKDGPTSKDGTTAGPGDASTMTCITCHNDEKGLAARHKSPDVSKLEKLDRLKKTGIDQEACFACHGSYEELAELTADCTLLTDKDGTTVNPHAAPDLTAGHKDMDCASCHRMHSTDDPAQNAGAYCVSCHHENIYECNTCH